MTHIAVGHDPVARHQTVREIVQVGALRTCDSCGGGRPRGLSLFRYGCQRDDRLSGRVDWFDGLFCSMKCMRSHHST